jgi:hypothetical protein
MTIQSFPHDRLFRALLAAVLAVGFGACAQAGDGAGEGGVLGEQRQAIGGRVCSAFDDEGNPNPDWPECNTVDGPTQGCNGYGTCYCVCRWSHRCDLNPAQCNPLSDCLNNCDAQYPSCPYPGGEIPPTLASCY